MVIYIDDETGMPSSAGERRREELVRRAKADAMADRAPTSHDPEYTEAYEVQTWVREVEAGRSLVCVAPAVWCSACFALDVHIHGYGCSCAAPSVANKRAGMVVAMGCDEPGQRFLTSETLAVLVQAGVRILSVDGQDITHEATPIQ